MSIEFRDVIDTAVFMCGMPGHMLRVSVTGAGILCGEYVSCALTGMIGHVPPSGLAFECCPNFRTVYWVLVGLSAGVGVQYHKSSRHFACLTF